MKGHNPHCFLAQHGVYERGEMPPCDGALVKAHLIPKQILKRTEGARTGAFDLYDDATWIFACGGSTGISGHHGAFDSAKTIRLPRAAIPAATESFARRYGLAWWLDREYGRRVVA